MSAGPTPPWNVRTRDYRARFALLPPAVQSLALKAFRAFLANPQHPALRHHQLQDNKKGSHRPGSFSVSINMQYRAICVVDGNTNVWYWVGTHAEYDQFTGRR